MQTVCNPLRLRRSIVKHPKWQHLLKKSVLSTNFLELILVNVVSLVKGGNTMNEQDFKTRIYPINIVIWIQKKKAENCRWFFIIYLLFGDLQFILHFVHVKTDFRPQSRTDVKGTPVFKRYAYNEMQSRSNFNKNRKITLIFNFFLIVLWNGRH